MESINVSHFENDAVLDKKLDGYGFEEKNFVAGQELTVTITLKEYRDLVSQVATKDDKIRQTESKKSEAEEKAKEAAARAETLKAENYDLQKRVSTLQDNLAELQSKFDVKSEEKWGIKEVSVRSDV